MQTPRFNPQEILSNLVRHEVQFVVVGGMSAILQGVPLSTFDLDVVYAVTEDNIQRLVGALQELDAIYRDPAGRKIAPTAAHLRAGGHNLLNTNLGFLDVLGYVGTHEEPLRYNQLLPGTVPFAISLDCRVLLLDLPALIQIKEAANRDKDRAALPILRTALLSRTPPP